MTSDQSTNAVLAIVLGTVAAVVLLIPVAAVQYRRDGRLGPGDLLTLLAAAVYGLALWTYTLLPMPATGDFTCQPRQLELLGSFRPLLERGVDAPAALLRDAEFLQVALNVVLFVPFGFFVRKILRRGFLVAGVLGFATSLLIETTQGTGVWGLYACPYRLFDVDDLLTNTTGALIGSFVSAIFISRAPRQVRLPRQVSLGRRWVAMACDALFILIVGSLAQLAYLARFYAEDPAMRGVDTSVQALLAVLVPGVVQALSVLGRGRTIGEWTVDLRTVAARPAWTLPGRVVKFVLGVGGYLFLLWLAPTSVPALPAFVLLTLVAAVPGRNHPGLANAVAGLRLEVDLPTDAATAREDEPGRL